MATAKEIADEILAKVKEEAEVTGDVSKYSLVNILIGATSYTLEAVGKDLETFSSSIENEADTQRVGSLYWYQNMALNFRYGATLIKTVEEYKQGNKEENKGELPNYLPTYHPDADNKGTKTVKFAKARTSGIDSSLQIGVAKDYKTPLNDDEYKAFVDYVNAIKVVGDVVTVTDPKSVFFDVEVSFTIVHSTTANATAVEREVNTQVTDFFNKQYLQSDFSKYSLSSHIINNVTDVKNVYDIEVLSVKTGNSVNSPKGVYSSGEKFFNINKRDADGKIIDELNLVLTLESE